MAAVRLMNEQNGFFMITQLTVSTVCDLGLHLNSGFSADDNVACATEKPVEFFFA